MSDLLPISASPQERALSRAVERMADIPPMSRQMWRPTDCPAALLPWLGWAFSVDAWSSSWTEAQRRAAIQQSVDIHQHKGTVGALRAALSTVGVSLEISEWHQQTPKGAPFTFRITLDGESSGWTRAQLLALLDMVYATKNLRSHLEAIEPIVKSTGKLLTGGASCIGSNITIEFGG